MLTTTNTRTEDLATRGRRRWVLPFLAALVVLSGVTWWFGPWSAPIRYSRSSLLDLRRIAEKDPQNQQAWRAIGLRLARAGDGGMAEPALRQALALNLADAEVATGLGEVLMSRGEYPEAFQVLRAAIEHQPDYLLARMALGRLYRRRGSHLNAAEQFRAVVDRDSRFADAWYELAICHLQMQQSAQAQNAIEQALREAPREPDYLALKGSIQVAVGEVDPGIEATRLAAELAPGDVRIQATLVNLLLAHHRSDDDLDLAEKTLEHLGAIAPQQQLLPYQRGQLHLLRGNWQQAVVDLEQARERSPGQDEVYYSLSQAYRRSGREAEADEVLAVYRRRQDLRRRIDDVRVALGSEPKDPAKLYEDLAVLQVNYGDFDAAINSLEQALTHQPDRESARARLADLRGSRPPAPGADR
jgi:tetratricopeptide (TPR) repeat protein